MDEIKQEPEKRRLGRISIMARVIDSFDLATEIFALLKFVPWQVEFISEENVFRMLGTSPEFREIEKDDPAPFYDVVVTRKVDDDSSPLSLTCTEQMNMVPLADVLTPESPVMGGKQ